MTYLEWLENPSSKYLKGPGYIILIYLTLHENNKKISRLSDLFKSTSYVKRRRRQRERQKKTIGLDWQNNNFARASRFFVHFFAVASRLTRKGAYFQVLSKTWTQDNDFLFLFLNLDTFFLEFNSRKIFQHLTNSVS